jgi:hypothetical protein
MDYLEFLKEIWDKLDRWAIILIEIGIIFGIIAFVFKYSYKSIIESIKYYKLVRKENEIHTSDLTIDSIKSHDIFTRFSTWETTKINNLRFGNSKKNLLFRKILNIKFNIIKDKTLELIASNFVEVNRSEFKLLVESNMSEMILEYNKNLKYELGKELYNFAIEGPNGFNQWHEKTIIYALSLIENICDSENIYDDNLEKMWAILNTHQSALDATLLSIEKTFYSFNGELDSMLEEHC